MNRLIKQKVLAVALIGALSMNTIAFADTTKNISVNYGGTAVLVNGKVVSLKDSSNKALEAITYNKTVYVPVKSLAAALNLTLAYDSKTKTVTLTSVAKTAPSGTPPTGTPPSGTPPTGTPPSGNPPTGTPPTGTPPGEAKATGTEKTTTPPTATVTVTKAVTKKMALVFSGIKVNLNGKVVSFKDSSGAVIEPFNYSGNIYVPLKAVATALGVTLTEDTTKGIISLVGQNNNAPTGTPPGNMTGTADNTVTGTGVLTVSTDQGTQTGKTIEATAANASGVKVTKGGVLMLTDSTVTKTGDSTAVETSNFTGLNAGILAENGAVLSLKNVTVNTNAEGSNAVVSTGNGTKVTIDGLTVNTTKDSSRGIHATYQGSITASNVNIYTKGAHSGAITTDRGEGTVVVNTGTVVTEGDGSPGIYSTGDITVTQLVSTAKGSEAAVIEGKNSITLVDSILYGAKKWGVMIYQSFSGDAGTGTGTFTMTGGSLTAETGPLFYSTNTTGVISLKGVTLQNASGVLIQADGNNQWGTKGSNGAKLTVTADTQNLVGSVNADAISSVDLTLKNNSTLKGALNHDKTASLMALTLDASSTVTLTADSYVTTLTDADASFANIISGGFNLYYDSSNAKNSYLEGKTITLSGGGVLAPMTK